MTSSTNRDVHYMQLALLEAQKAFDRDEVPVGAVLVKDNVVIARGYNHPIEACDPSAHAEMVALRLAARLLQNYRLPDCELFVTLEPCLMCAGAIMQSRLSRLVFGAYEPKTGACGSQVNMFDNQNLNHHTRVVHGVMQEACSQILKDFFLKRRAQQAAQKKQKDPHLQ